MPFFVLLLGAFCAVSAPAADDLEAVNEALRQWLAAAETDRPYLLLDLEAGELRLQHGGALLRQCPLRDPPPAALPISARLAQRLRPFRHTSAVAGPGPFDWEAHLGADGHGACALYFGGGLLVYADGRWLDGSVDGLQIGAEDVRALFNALELGAPMVVLPASWRRWENAGETHGETEGETDGETGG